MSDQIRRSLETTVELLAPAGDLTCMQAAIENGADAVYFGLDRGFNARARAANLSLQNLPDIMGMLHERRVAGYVTLNTLVFSDELSELQRVIGQIAQAGVDAVLVQDFGVARLVRHISPDLSIHASTQMTLTSAECIQVAEELGIERVVLPRELSLAEVEAIGKACTAELEMFVHGALCVAYSGQCLTSESLGGRSANRGQCAQACRLPYELYRDGEHVELGDVKYLLSPQDLCVIDQLPKLVAAGVHSLKIEGRLKQPEYVASVTRNYREALDSALAGDSFHLSDLRREEMELTFSRGFSPGWTEGCDHKRLVPGNYSAKRGVFVGRVERMGPTSVDVRLERDLSVGDGVMFEAGKAQNEQPGGNVFSMRMNGRRVDSATAGDSVQLSFRDGAIDWDDLRIGQELFKTHDPRVSRRLRRQVETRDPIARLPVDLEVHASEGESLRVVARVGSSASVTLVTQERLERARQHALDEKTLETQFGRLGKSRYYLRRLEAHIQGTPMVPLSILGHLRKQLLSQLDEQLGRRPVRHQLTNAVYQTLQPHISHDRTRQSSQLSVMCRTPQQLEVLLQAAEEIQIDLVIADFSDIRQYTEAVRNASDRGVRLAVATPRIQKPNEVGIFRSMLKSDPQIVLARNLASLHFFGQHGRETIADYSLNVANELSAEWIMSLGPRRFTPSYDLNRDQLLSLVGTTPPAWMEVVIHQHMPMFHMEHCVFCAVMSPGTNKTNCGRPCDDHLVHLEDRVGMKHLLTADVGCRNTLFNAQAQSSAEIVPELLAAGIRWFRVELLEQSDSSTVLGMLRLYRKLLSGTVSGRQVWTHLKAANRVGVTRGTLEERRNPLAIL